MKITQVLMFLLIQELESQITNKYIETLILK